MLTAFPNIRNKALNDQKVKANGQTSLFDNPGHGSSEKMSVNDDLPKLDEFSKTDLMLMEKRLLGFYLTDNPLSKAIDYLETKISHRIFEIDPYELQGKRIKIGGLIVNIKKVFTKKGNNEMAFISLDDQTGVIDLVIFPKIFSSFKSKLFEDNIILVMGKLDSRDDRISLIVEEIEEYQDRS
jgi:DNA polymerase III subunit alpha